MIDPYPFGDIGHTNGYQDITDTNWTGYVREVFNHSSESALQSTCDYGFGESEQLEFLDLDSRPSDSSCHFGAPESVSVLEILGKSEPPWHHSFSKHADATTNHVSHVHDMDDRDRDRRSQEDAEAAEQLLLSLDSNVQTGSYPEPSESQSRSSGNQTRASSSKDPLEGMDDLRAMLKAAAYDEECQRKQTKKPVKRSPTMPRRKSKTASSPLTEIKALLKTSATATPTKLVSVTHIPQRADEPPCIVRPTPDSTYGMIPKYRAKNRLRSIIKRKPGTQDTDLMSSNVEILGGRVDKQTLAWLRDNFEEKPGQIMRREFLYERYLEFCKMTGREAMNAACVGKVVRTVFQGLSTRRLGRRGGSKYHYVNLQVVATSPFASMRQSIGNIQKTGRKSKKLRSQSLAWADALKLEAKDNAIDDASNAMSTTSTKIWAKSQKKLEAVELEFVTSGLSDEERSKRNVVQLAHNCLLDLYNHVDEYRVVPPELADPSRWPDLLELQKSQLALKNLSASDVYGYLFSFRIHLGMLGAVFLRMNWHCVPEIIENFWQHKTVSLQVPDYLPAVKYRNILELPSVQFFVKLILVKFYERLHQFFFPKKHGPISEHMRSASRDLCCKYVKWNSAATHGLPRKMREIVISTAFGFTRVTEAVLDLSSSVDHLSHLEKQKSSRGAFFNVCDAFRTNGCLLLAQLNPADRSGVMLILNKLLELADTRAAIEQWDSFVADYLQLRSTAPLPSEAPENVHEQDPVALAIETLDGFGSTWTRLCMEIEGSLRFPGLAGIGPFSGVLRFLRDSVSYLIEHQKAKILKLSLIALIAEGVVGLIRDTAPQKLGQSDYVLEHFVQCGIPKALVNSCSREFFLSVPELAGWIRNYTIDVEGFCSKLDRSHVDLVQSLQSIAESDPRANKKPRNR